MSVVCLSCANEKPEEKIADVLLELAPPKIEGGSKPRQNWIGLITEVQAFLHDNGWDMEAFVKRMNK